MQEQLPHTWSLFFARHGNVTATQREAIPPILAGNNTLLLAATASGKTEAAIAPLLERHIFGTNALPRQAPALQILYICPMRALVRDLYERLHTPLTDLGVTLAMKSGDTGPVSLQRPPTVLITTPESTDSLLTRAPRLLGELRAVVLDEIHLFDATPRGDHLICLLKRIEHIRHYRAQESGQKAAPRLQRVALSATVANPSAMAERYLTEATEPVSKPSAAITIVEVASRSKIDGALYPMVGLDDLVRVLDLQMTGQSQRRKALVFCNARNEVEQIAAYLRQHLPFEAPIFVHYSNLDPTLRQEVEEQLSQASSGICVCTSTLELGIDIGTIELIVLVGPPPSPAAFVQRIGRAGRRRRMAYVVGMARSRREEVRFQALYQLAQATHPLDPDLETRHFFCLSVLVQQSFSILKQSPTGGIRLADLRRIAPSTVDDQTLRHLLNHLVAIHHLKPGRPGEWRPGPALEELVDAYEIYANIGAAPLSMGVVDAYTGRTIAQTTRGRVQGDTLLLGGRLVQVVWRTRYEIGVRPNARGIADEELHTHAAPFAVPLEVSQAVATLLGFSPGEMVHLQTEEGNWLFHFWGDIYGKLLASILGAHWARVAEAREYGPEHRAIEGRVLEEDELAQVEPVNEHCLQISSSHISGQISSQLFSHYDPLPIWDARVVRQQMQQLLPRLEPFLELGRFHFLLPPELAMQAVVERVDLPRFERLYQAATVISPTADQREQLLRLLE